MREREERFKGKENKKEGYWKICRKKNKRENDDNISIIVIVAHHISIQNRDIAENFRVILLVILQHFLELYKH